MAANVYIPCEQCGAINRVAADKINEGPVCSRCKNSLEAGRPLQVKGEQFDKVVRESGLPVLVDFWAPWCGPCQAMHPILEEVAKKYKGRVIVTKLNTDEAPQISQNFGISGIPTLILLKGGAEVKRQVGAVSIGEVEKMIADS